MGGRGASSGFSVDKAGNPKQKYGTEYRTLLQSGNIKYIVPNTGSAKTPMETMTKGRVYATVNAKNEIKAITYYDKDNKRFKQIDVSGRTHHIGGKPELPHTHHGYQHEEYGGTKLLSPKEHKMVERVLKTWYYHNSK